MNIITKVGIGTMQKIRIGIGICISIDISQIVAISICTCMNASVNSDVATSLRIGTGIVFAEASTFVQRLLLSIMWLSISV